jgi:hypothetical protein
MNPYIYLLASLLGTAQTYPAIKSYHSNQILNFIFAHLPKQGILSKDERGMVYVKVDNNYIHQLIEFIQLEGFEVPPYFGEGMHGAHITVMTPEEILYYAVGEIQECGHVVRFEPKQCQIVHPETWNPGELAYLVTVEAPLLHQLREKYVLPANKYDFHITVGVKHPLKITN